MQEKTIFLLEYSVIFEICNKKEGTSYILQYELQTQS